MRRALGRLALVAGGLLVGGLLAEGALRLAAPQPTGASPAIPHPTLIARMAPGRQGTISLPGLYRYRYAHDDEGRRITPHSAETGAAGTVLLLGDSFAYGMGVDDDETLANVLAWRLGQRGTPARVVNAAAIGKGPAYALRMLETVGRDWRGDAVVYAFYPNDFANLRHELYARLDDGRLIDPGGDAPTVRQRARIANLPGAQWVGERSHLAGLLRVAALATFGTNGPGPEAIDLDTTRTPTAYHVPQTLPLARAVLAALDSTVQARGGRLITLYVPSAAEVAAFRRTGAPSADEAAFDGVRRSLGLDGVSATPALASSGAPIATLYYPEIHWRAPAHALGAQGLLDPVQAALCEHGLSRPGCGEAPEAVRQIAAARAGLRSAGSSRRTPAD